MPAVSVPTLTVRGGLDKVICNSTIEQWHDSLDEKADKAMITLDDTEHDILSDRESLNLVFNDITNWLHLRC